MKTIITFFSVSGFLLITLFYSDSSAQIRFRSGMFFHHSTGECIWGPNGSSTSVPQEMTRYNIQHSYIGQNAVTLSETWFPVNYDNEWVIWHNIFETNTPENISSYFGSNKIIMIKSCFPSSALEEWGQPSDTLTPDYKTVYNYKWHWRHIIRVMKNRPQNYFVIWTNAPLTPALTNQNAALLSKRFCKWAKDTLARGLDPVFGVFPNNVYVFDFFTKLTDANGYMLLQYAQSPNDPHPNAVATALVAPQLVDEVFDHSIAYEQLYGIRKINEKVPEDFKLYQNYPNPFNPKTTISFSIPHTNNKDNLTLITIYDILGRELEVILNEKLQPGNYEIEWDGTNYTSGIYYYKLFTVNFSDVKKMILVK
jgi:hypothetical protein